MTFPFSCVAGYVLWSVSLAALYYHCDIFLDNIGLQGPVVQNSPYPIYVCNYHKKVM